MLKARSLILKFESIILERASCGLQHTRQILRPGSSRPEHEPMNLEAKRPAPERRASPRPRCLSLTL